MMSKTYQLTETNFAKAQNLFASLDEHLALQALIAGVAPGKIYVDNRNQPRAALARVQKRFYLAGDPHRGFSEGLHRLFDRLIYPSALENGETTFVLTYTPGWEETIKDVILRGKHPMSDRRHTYVLESKPPASNWRALLKPGYDLRLIDKELLADKRLGNVQALQDEVRSEAPSTEAFLRDRFGVCVVRDDQEIIGWALSEYNLGNRCEVGIETVEGHRRQGIATITGSALVEEAVRRGVTRIGWHCWASNAGSIATALRLGFEKVEETDVYFAWFDHALNLAVNGNMQFFQEAYTEALIWYGRAFEAGATAPWWAYWNAARAAASVNKREHALQYLQQAIAGGFQDAEAIQSSEHLAALHDLAEWRALLSSLNK